MKRLILYLLILGAGLFQMVNAQTVIGVVTGSDDGQPLPGVNVQLKGSGLGTITDLNGQYTIDVAGESPVLIFSFIGYTRQETEVNGQSTIDIQLEVKTTGIDEAKCT